VEVKINRQSLYFNMDSTVAPLDYRGDAVLAIDPSKSNTAIIVGTPTGEVKSILQLSGASMEVSEFLLEVKRFLRQYLATCTVILIGQEAPIAKKGFEYYHSMKVLNDIHGVLVNFFLEEFRVKVTEVNNWTWKSAILPKEYRSKDYAKGSYAYLSSEYPGYTHDVTDAICIYRYILRYCADYKLKCTEGEKCKYKYNYLLIPIKEASQYNPKEFTYNKDYSLLDNIAYYVNRQATPGVAKISPEWLQYTDIYKHSYMFGTIPNGEVALVCFRC